MVYKNPFPKDFKATILLSIDNKLLENRAKTKNASTNNKTTRHSAHRSTRFIIPFSPLASPAQKENEKQFFNLLKNLVRPPRGSKTKFPQRPRLKRIPANRSHPTGKYLASRRYRGEGGLHPHYTTQRAAIVSPVISLSLLSLFSLLSFFLFYFIFFPPLFFPFLFFPFENVRGNIQRGELPSKSRCVHSLWFHGTQSIMVDNETSGGRKIVIRVVAIGERERERSSSWKTPTRKRGLNLALSRRGAHVESHEEVMLAPWSGHDPLGMVQTKNRGMCAHREKERVKLYVYWKRR